MFFSILKIYKFSVGEQRLESRGISTYTFEAQKKTKQCFFLPKTNIYNKASYPKLLISEIIKNFLQLIAIYLANSLYRLVTNNGVNLTTLT